MPPAPPSWANEKTCFACNRKFGIRKRRYHCRACGQSYCYDHCNIFIDIPQLGFLKKVRVCSTCEVDYSPLKRMSSIAQPFEKDRVSKNREKYKSESSPQSCSSPEIDYSSFESSNLSTDDEDIYPEGNQMTGYSSWDSDTVLNEERDSVESNQYDENCHALTPRAIDLTPKVLEPFSLSVMTYNVWMMPDKVTKFARSVSPNKEERALRMALQLPVCDAIVLEESFCLRTRGILLHSLAQQGYIHRSPVVGRVESGIRPLDGGVVLVSRYPIIHAETKKFRKICVGDDRLADKGILYVALSKDSQIVHIFATHTQAWNYPKAQSVRQKQFQLLRSFIDEKKIPSYEPVIVMGDLNVDRWEGYGNDSEYANMLRTLNCEESEITEELNNMYSFDGKSNILAAPGLSSDGACELLDHVLYSVSHRQPVKATTRVYPIKSISPWPMRRGGKTIMVKDLSDHYPVIGNFEF